MNIKGIPRVINRDTAHIEVVANLQQRLANLLLTTHQTPSGDAVKVLNRMEETLVQMLGTIDSYWGAMIEDEVKEKFEEAEKTLQYELDALDEYIRENPGVKPN